MLKLLAVALLMMASVSVSRAGAGSLAVPAPVIAAGTWYCLKHKFKCLAAGGSAAIVYANKDKISSAVGRLIERKVEELTAKTDLPDPNKSNCSDEELTRYNNLVGTFCKNGVVRACKASEPRSALPAEILAIKSRSET